MDALWISLGVVFVAELGDKTQLVALSFGARHRVALVVAGVAIAQTVSMGLSVLAGGALGAVLPGTLVGVLAAAAFFGFALWTWRDRDGDDAATALPGGGRAVVLTVAVTVFVAELGDKTMLAAATLAARQDVFWTWVGATVGIVLAGALAVVAGNALGARLPRDVVRRTAAGLFVLFGVLLLADTLLR